MWDDGLNNPWPRNHPIQFTASTISRRLGPLFCLLYSTCSSFQWVGSFDRHHHVLRRRPRTSRTGHPDIDDRIRPRHDLTGPGESTGWIRLSVPIEYRSRLHHCVHSSGQARWPAAAVRLDGCIWSVRIDLVAVSAAVAGSISPRGHGLVVAMVGIELIALAAPRFLGFQSSERIDPRAVFVAALSLAAMIGPSIWSTGKLKLYPVLLGLTCGYVSAYAVGLLSAPELLKSFAGSLVSLPRRGEIAWSFDVSLLPAFFIASLASTLKSVGDLTLCQKSNDLEWKRTDLKSVSGGILAASIGTTVAGLFGGIGQSRFSSNVGLSIATGATSRHIALPCGVILILLAFIQGLAAIEFAATVTMASAASSFISIIEKLHRVSLGICLEIR